MGWRNKIRDWGAFLGIERTSDELTREQFRLLAQQIPILYCLIIVNSLFTAIATYGYVGFWASFGFPIFAFPIMIARLVQWRKRAKNHHDSETIENIRKALKTNIIAANIFALILGIWAVNIMAYVPDAQKAFIPLFTVLSMISCAYCLMSLPLAAYSIMISGSTMIAFAMGYSGNTMLMAMAGNVMLVTVLIIYMVSKQYKQLQRLIESRSKMIEQRAYANELAHQDQLTGLPNRRALVDALYKLKYEKAERPVAMAMIDLNGFKPVNDTYGHAAGDKLLMTLSKRLRELVGKTGLVARLGGDEFAILIREPKSLDWLYRKAEQVIHTIARPIMIEEHELRIGAAIGFTTKDILPEDPLELLQHSDIALYEAKSQNSYPICLFEGNMEARVKRKTLIEQALSDREQMKEIKLHYQPIFCIRDGSHIGFEALARWEHPELGSISPVEFVGAAERNGLVTRLTIHLFREALRTAQNWDRGLRLSFNLSGSGLGTSGLDQVLPDIIREMSIDPNRLSVEVTETALLNDPAAARKVLKSLQEIGVSIILDDFGAGYASIGYLREMNFDGIKLDGSLIEDIVESQASRDLLLGVLHLCQAIGSKVTAEMVENEEQLSILRSLPVENVQGYLLGRPVAADDTHTQDPDKRLVREKLFAA